jgi:hypothetical protein
MTTAEPLVILTRTYDLLLWILPHCERFPRGQRFLVTQRLADATLNVQEALLDAHARTGRGRWAALQAADGHLSKVRLYLRLAHEWRWLNAGQYEHVSALIAEIGRLLGGWLKQARTDHSR